MINKKRVEVNLDMRTAVNYAEVQILHNIGAFFIDTDFGRICIETNAYRTINPTRPVCVCLWSEAPDTDYAVDRSDDSADYWASVDIYGKMLTDHLSIIEVFTRCMFMHLGFDHVDEAVIDAAVYLYVAVYDPYSVNINMIEKEFRSNHLSSLHMGKRKERVLQTIVREFFMRKIDAAERVYRRSERYLSEYMEKSDSTFFDEYCKELFGIILYANNEQKESQKYQYRRLMEYDEIANVDKSVSPLKDLMNDGSAK